jgi:hypothetical protein
MLSPTALPPLVPFAAASATGVPTFVGEESRWWLASLLADSNGSSHHPVIGQVHVDRDLAHTNLRSYSCIRCVHA